MAMQAWLQVVTEHAVVLIDWMALVLIGIGTIEAFVNGLRAMLTHPGASHETRAVWLRYARWLVAETQSLRFPGATVPGPKFTSGAEVEVIVTDGDQVASWEVIVRDGTATTAGANGSEPHAVVRVDVVDWLALISGKTRSSRSMNRIFADTVPLDRSAVGTICSTVPA